MNSRKLAKAALKKGATKKVTELSPLISLLKKRKLRTIVEIGTEKGGTLYAWCRIAQPDAAFRQEQLKISITCIIFWFYKYFLRIFVV